MEAQMREIMNQNVGPSVSCKDEIGNAMAKYFNNPEMSDLTLKLAGKTFHAHKFVLGLMSDVFRTMCSQRWEANGVDMELELLECDECIPVFDRFLKFMYCGTATLDIDSALPLLMLADKYNVEPLKHNFEQFMNKKVIEGSVTGALRWLSYAQMSAHTILQNACIDVIVTKMDDVVQSDDFLHLELGFLLALLARDDLVVLWEQTIYESVLRWINAQRNLSTEHLTTLLTFIRFPMMLPTQLHKAEESELFRTHNHILSPMFAAAHRFRSIAMEVMNDAFAEPNFRPRNYTHKLWCHYCTVDMNGETFYQTSIGAQCLNHPVIPSGTLPEQLWQIQIMGDRRTSRHAGNHKSSSTPNLGYSFSSSSVVVDRTIPLMMTVMPTKPIRRNIAVDVSLFQVKKEKIVRYLCQASLKFTPEDEIMEADRKDGIVRNSILSGGFMQQQHQKQQQPNGTLKFSPSPMHFSFMFQASAPPKKNEVVLKYNFGSNSLDHPAEVPCFKFNGPLRMTNSVRVAIIFKPRFVLENEEEKAGEVGEASGLEPMKEADSGINCQSFSDDSDSNFLG